MTPGAIEEYQIEVMATANLFRQGHRICLDVTCLDLPTGVAGATNAEYVPYHLAQQDGAATRSSTTASIPRMCCCRSSLWKARPKTQAAISFLVSKLSSISTLLGSRKKICQRVLLGTWLTR